jgi:hypothetical protein
MLQVKIGIQLASLRLPFKKALATAAQLGAQAVEIDARGEIKPADLTRSAARQVRKMLEDLNLRVCAVSFRTRHGYNVAENLEARVDATKEAMRMAYDLGANVVINQVGRIPAEPAGPAWELLLHRLGAARQRVGCSRRGLKAAAILPTDCRFAPTHGVNFDPGNLVVNTFHDRASRLARLACACEDGARPGSGRGVEAARPRVGRLAHLLGVLEERQYGGYFTIDENATDPCSRSGRWSLSQSQECLSGDWLTSGCRDGLSQFGGACPFFGLEFFVRRADCT